MESVWQDLRYAARSVCRVPGFTIAVVSVLVLGSGVNTAVFSLVDEALIRPLPYEDPDRLVFLSETHPKRGAGGALRPANFFDLRSRNDVFEDMTAFTDVQVELTGTERPERISAQPVLEGFFPLLGVRALIGRSLEARDYAERENGAVAVLSHGFWQSAFAADPQVIGRTLRLDSRPFTIVGVMPSEFQGVGGRYQLWVPWVLAPQERANRQTHEFFALARLREGVSLQQASVQTSTFYRQLATQFPTEDGDWSLDAAPWQDVLLGRTRRVLVTLMTAAGIILLIAIANVASLQLARGVDREREMAVRLALGASRKRILRQLFVEGMLLAGMGGGLSLLAALGLVPMLSAVSLPTAIPFEFHPQLNASVLAVTIVVSVLCGLLFGLSPALHVSRIELGRWASGQALAAGGRRPRMRQLLVLTQVALGFVLLVAGFLTLESFMGLLHVDLGFEPRGVLSVALNLPEARYPNDDSVRVFERRLLGDVRSIPGVTTAATASGVPLTRISRNFRFRIEGGPSGSADQYSADVLFVSPSFFRSIGCRVTSGREFAESDVKDDEGVIVIDETLAHAYWPGQSAIGKRIQFLYADLEGRSFSVIGIVPPVKYGDLSASAGRTLYVSQAQLPGRNIHLLLRTAFSPAISLDTVAARIKEIDPDLPLGDVQTLDQRLRETLSEPRLRTLLLTLLGVLALVLASTGLYGLLAYSVARRIREMGIRLTLGAQRGDVLWLVMRQGLTLTSAGIGCGLVLAVVLARVLGSSSYGIGSADPTAYAGVAMVLTGVAALASYLPARRAARVEPAAALRVD